MINTTINQYMLRDAVSAERSKGDCLEGTVQFGESSFYTHLVETVINFWVIYLEEVARPPIVFIFV